MLIFLLLLSFQQYCVAIESSKDNMLVEILKNSLRKNNFDYIDKFNNINYSPIGINVSASVNTQQPPELTYNTTEPTNLIINGTNRRYLDLSAEIDYNKYSFSPKTTLNTSPTTTAATTTTTKPTTSETIKSKITSKKHLKSVAKSQRDKLFKYMNKHQQLEDVSDDKKGKSEWQWKPVMRLTGSQEMQEIKKMKSEKKAPVADQLDLSPARGSLIDRMRVDGRLCDRSVLIPEGPKYDSKGNMYLRPFVQKPNHPDYPHTSPAAIVLPKCCNCCKKSVLGCD